MQAVFEDPAPTLVGRKKSQVLVVDDEQQMLVALEDALCDDYEVLTANSPLKALRMLEREKDVAVVISDQRMPGMTGDELLSLSSDLSDATRVMVTGYAELAAVVRAVNNGRIFAYLTKPWNLVELQLTVKKCVEHFELLRKLARERQLLEDLMNNIPDAIYFKDFELKFQRVNNACASRVALNDTTEAVGKRLVDLGINPDTALAVERDEARILADGLPASNLVRVFDAPEGRRFYSTTIAPVRAPGGSIQGLVGISRDVTEREETVRALRRLTHVRTMLGAVNATIVRARNRDTLMRESCRIAEEEGGLLVGAIALVDPETGNVTSLVSHGGEELAQGFVDKWAGLATRDAWNRTTIVRTREPSVANNLEPEQASAWQAEIWQEGGRSIGLFPLSVDGGVAGVFLLVAAQPDFFDGEEVRLLSELADNIAFALDHVQKSARLDFLAYYDSLTNLPKRELLMDRLHQLLPGLVAHGEGLAVLVLDLSRFRHVNDTLGRGAGDQLLVEVSKRLTQVLVEGDTLARFDSNSFAILVTTPGDEAELASWVEKAVVGVLAAPVSIQGTELRVAFRIGIAMFPTDSTEADGLVRNAEAALAKARRTGERCVFYAPSMNARVADKFSLETRLRRALEEQQFVLHYQPKVDLRTDAVVGLEALIRWQDPERGLILPTQFIGMLEETGLIIEVGAWVLERAAAQYAEWVERGFSPPRIAANVSAMQLSQRGFVRSVEHALERHPLARGRLDLEITESVLMDDFAGNVSKLACLKEQGVRIAIDDFGTGYSSLGYLSRLPVDAMKIDRSFVIRMSDDPQDMTIVTTIISLAHSLDLYVVAEGVETLDQARLLRLVKCDQIQGYLVGKPQAQDDVVEHFRTDKKTWPPSAK